MKKFIAAVAFASAISLSGAAFAAEPLSTQSMDEVTAGTLIGGVQYVSVVGTGNIRSHTSLSGNVAGSGATADASGYATFTDTKAYTVTVAGVGSSSTAVSVSGSQLPPRPPRPCGCGW